MAMAIIESTWCSKGKGRGKERKEERSYLEYKGKERAENAWR